MNEVIAAWPDRVRILVFDMCNLFGDYYDANRTTASKEQIDAIMAIRKSCYVIDQMVDDIEEAWRKI
jgi:isochorismate hydrolase